jgi:hypothetical protein
MARDPCLPVHALTTTSRITNHATALFEREERERERISTHLFGLFVFPFRSAAHVADGSNETNGSITSSTYPDTWDAYLLMMLLFCFHSFRAAPT